MSGSAPEAVFGKAITSRSESAPTKRWTMRSRPYAIPPCGRRPVTERLEQEAEPILSLVGADPDRLEHTLLELPVGDSNRATAHLLTIPDEVVGGGQRLARALGVELPLRGGERMVERVPARLLLVPLEHGPVHDPHEPFLVPDQLEALRQLDPQLSKDGVGDLGAIGDQKQEVPLLGAKPRVERAELGGA